MTTRNALVVMGLLFLVGAGVGVWWYIRPPSPPPIPLTGLDRDVADAIEEARGDVLLEPRSAEAWGTLGRVLLANEVHPQISLVCFREAERLDPKNPRWPYFASGVLLNLGQPDEAGPGLERAVVLADRGSDKSLTPRLLLAETQFSHGETDAAQGHFQRVLLLDPNNVRAHFGMALLASGRRDWADCRAHLEPCLGSPQSRKKAAAHLATIFARLGDKDSADRYAALERSLPKDFDWFDPLVAEHSRLKRRKRDRYRDVEQLEAEGRMADAAKILEQLLARYPDDYMPYLMMGRILPQMGQFDLAEQHLHQAREIAHDKVQIHYLLGLVLLKRGEALLDHDKDKARAVLEQSVASANEVLKLRPDFGYAHMSLGLSLKYLDRRREALAAFREAVHCNPEHGENHYFLGLMLAEEGDLKSARPYIEHARLLAGPNDLRAKAAFDKYFGQPDK